MAVNPNFTNVNATTPFFSTGGGGGGVPDPLSVSTILTQAFTVSSINGGLYPPAGGGSVVAQTLYDGKASGTAGGEGSNYVGVYYRRDINSGFPALNPVSIGIVESVVIPGLRIDTVNNVMSVPAGTWQVCGAAPACAVGRNKCRLYNTTDSNVVCEGIGTYYSPDNYTSATAPIFGCFTIAQAKNFEFQHQIETTPISGIPTSNSMGLPMGFAGDPEVFSVLTFTKLG